MKAHYSALIVSFLLAATATDSFAQTSPAEKMAELKWMIGEWKLDGTWLEDETKLTGTLNCSWLFDETVVECENVWYFGELEMPEHILYSYDGVMQSYSALYHFKGVGKSFPASFLKNGDAWTMQGEVSLPGVTFWNQMRYTPKGDQIEMVQYRSTNGGVVEKVADVAIMKM